MSTLIRCLLLASSFGFLYPVAAQDLIVAAAADLSPMEKQLAAGFREASGLTVRFSFGSSGMLARQVAEGAPFDVYLSANEGFVKEVTAAGHLDPATVKSYATGRIGLWSADGKVKNVEDLDTVRTLSMANPRHAPYGIAAEEFLKSTGSFGRVQSKLILAENVRQAFEFARTRNTDAVITSWTLLYDKGGVLLPDSRHSPIRQSGGVLKSSKQPEAARKFMEFLTGPRGQAILRAGGLFQPK